MATREAATASNATPSLLRRWAREGTRRRRALQLANRARAAYSSGGLRLLATRGARWLRRRYRQITVPDAYQVWIAQFEPTAAELEAQRHWSQRSAGPAISIVMPLYRTPLKVLKDTLGSIQSQTYPHWELCLALADDESPRLKNWLKRQASADSRIRIVRLERNTGISAASNVALQAARGEFVALMDHDDLLAPCALYEVARCLAEHPETDLVYSDEDHLTGDGRTRKMPVFKPGWSPEMLLNHNYVCHFLVLRRSVLLGIGGFRPECDGAQDWDVVLRVSERTDRIRHIPKILYHWREVETSTAKGIESKPYVTAAQQRTLRDHFARQGLAVEVQPAPWGLMRCTWPVEDQPLVSIVIPSKDRFDLILRCVLGLLYGTAYRNIEIIVVDSGSTDPEVLRFYDQMQAQGRLRVVSFAGPFNYSAACNLGARASSGDYLLFLNNDTEIIEEDWLEELVRWAQRPGIGLVGPKLIYPDGRVQHAGMVLGLQGLVGHLFYQCPEYTAGLFGAVEFNRNLMAVTGACQLISRDLFRQAGGFDEGYELLYSDVALCLAVRQLGYRILYTPYSRLVHHECSTRPAKDHPGDARRFAELLRTLAIAGDPYFPSALSAQAHDPQFRREGEFDVTDNLRVQADRLLSSAHTAPQNPIRELLRVQGAELFRQFPAALLPTGAAKFLAWARVHLPQYTADDHQVFWQWLYRHRAEALAESWLQNTEWQQRFPLGLTVFGREEFLEHLRSAGHLEDETVPAEVLSPLEEVRLKAQHDEHLAALLRQGAGRELVRWARANPALDEPWIDALEQELEQTDLTAPGLNLIGHFGYAAGVGQVARSYRAAARAAGLPVACRNVVHLGHSVHNQELAGLEDLRPDLYDITCLAIQPDEEGFRRHLQSIPSPYRETNYRIGLWVYELDTPPECWRPTVSKVDEVWCPSEHVAAAVRKIASIPVRCIPYSLDIGAVTPVRREELGVPADHLLFLFVFDASSVVERKNPLALIEAFRQAFAPWDRATLVLKVSQSQSAPEELARLRAAARGLNVVFLTAPMSRQRTYGLIQACDCYVSLHRGEGFGLTMAEAMWFGKPVIATAYSANLDYMRAENSLLVPCELVTIPAGLPFYGPPQQWAEPSVSAAAEHIRWVYQNREAARELGARAQQDVQAQLAPEAVGRLMRERLQEIRDSRQGLTSREPVRTEDSASELCPVRTLVADWGEDLKRDPFHNPNLALDNPHFRGYRQPRIAAPSKNAPRRTVLRRSGAALQKTRRLAGRFRSYWQQNGLIPALRKAHLKSQSVIRRHLSSVVTSAGPRIDALAGDPRQMMAHFGRIGLDAFLTENCTLSFPTSATPAVSIILVLHNRAELTLTCLNSLLASRDVPCEIILVDNASTDRTPELLARLRNVRVIRNETNVGFGPAVNQAARQAAGEFLLFLNNDAQVLGNSIESAARFLSENEAVGAVGGKILLLDGTLQEAGCIVWQDGAGTGYGRGDNPYAAPYMFRRDVDFCSGAFLMTRRELFLKGGGFHPAFDPAYYEDVDYCVRLIQDGWRVVYLPEVNLLHYESASSASSEAAQARIAAKREAFVERHRDWLAQKLPHSRAALLKARDGRRAGPRILFIDDYIPQGRIGAGIPRTNRILKEMVNLGYVVTFFPMRLRNESWSGVYSDVPREAELILAGGYSRLRDFLVERRGYYDLLFVSRPINLSLLREAFAGEPGLLDDVSLVYDAEAIFSLRDAERAELNGRPIPAAELNSMIRKEAELATEAVAVTSVSEREAAHFRRHGCRNVQVLSHALQPAVGPMRFPERSGLLFVGPVRDADSPNADSVQWYCREILPALRNCGSGDIEATFAGEWDKQAVPAEVGSSQIRQLGEVGDLTPVYDQARVFIAPTRFAAGIPLKVIEAAAHGVPAVVTPLLAGQLGWQDGEELLVAATAEEFARACIRLHDDQDLWERIRANALRRVQQDHSINAFRRQLGGVLAEALGRSSIPQTIAPSRRAAA